MHRTALYAAIFLSKGCTLQSLAQLLIFIYNLKIVKQAEKMQ
jgi:hypothetical protein